MNDTLMFEKFIVTRTRINHGEDEVNYWNQFNNDWVSFKINAHPFDTYPDAVNAIQHRVMRKSGELYQVEKVFIP